MLRFIVLAIPLLILLLALFGFTVEILDLEPRDGSVVKLAVLHPPLVPEPLVIGAWLVEACGLTALFLMAQGRCGRWWLDGLVAGWLAWIFRGPLLVITIVVAMRQPQQAWWTLAFGWWVLYSVCGLSLAWLAKHTELDVEADLESEPTEPSEPDDSEGSHHSEGTEPWHAEEPGDRKPSGAAIVETSSNPTLEFSGEP